MCAPGPADIQRAAAAWLTLQARCKVVRSRSYEVFAGSGATRRRPLNADSLVARGE